MPSKGPKPSDRMKRLVYLNDTVVAALDGLARREGLTIDGRPNRSGMIAELVIRECQRLRLLAARTSIIP